MTEGPLSENPAADVAAPAPEWGPSDAPPRMSVLDEVRELVIAIRAMVASELAWQAARASAAGKAALWAALFAVIALFCGFFVLMALVVGLLLALGQAIGPWWALLAVTGGLFLTVALAGIGVWRKARRIVRLFSDKTP